MIELLNNPVFHALNTGDQHLSFGNTRVKYFDPSVSPFVGIDLHYEEGFKELHELLPEGRNILHATIYPFSIPGEWQLIRAIEGLQFVFGNSAFVSESKTQIIPLDDRHIPQMLELTALTRPGPFGLRTIDFGHYYGIFEEEKLVAMTGQRLHIGPYTEISAVCTHPDHLGKGYAAALVTHQVQLILSQEKMPMLHVSASNERAIRLYERLGFAKRGIMNFYFMKRK